MPQEPPICTRVFDLFKVGIGPSSSHTMGPMSAAADFRKHLRDLDPPPAALRVVLHGSLGATGKGHGTDRAVLAGLCGHLPAAADRQAVQTLVDRVRQTGRLDLGGVSVPFDPASGLVWAPLSPDLPHPNTLDFEALDAHGARRTFRRYLSVGGGFVEWIDTHGTAVPLAADAPPVGPPRHAFCRALDVVRASKRTGQPWWSLMLDNEIALGGCSEEVVLDRLRGIWGEMRACIRRGIDADPTDPLPGPLHVRRRAPAVYRNARTDGDPASVIGPVERLAHAYALAVNEENAAGGRVVTAPTNGAAGVVPAVFAAVQDRRGWGDATLCRGLLSAGLIGAVIKRMASLSGAELGCQGEVGSASAMAAGGLVDMLGGSADQVEMAAEICIEHHLGMTCDPVAGLVQIPCIERNVMGAVKALNAAALATASDGKHRIALDEALGAMRQIGLDMDAKYKETARGGLAAVSSAPHRVAC